MSSIHGVLLAALDVLDRWREVASWEMRAFEQAFPGQGPWDHVEHLPLAHSFTYDYPPTLNEKRRQYEDIRGALLKKWESLRQSLLDEANARGGSPRDLFLIGMFPAGCTPHERLELYAILRGWIESDRDAALLERPTAQDILQALRESGPMEKQLELKAVGSG